jgi:hypothetical protein
VEERLGEPAEAQLLLNASLKGEKVDANAYVDGIKNRSPDLRLQIALVEEQLSYSGEGGLRFHPMVVRNLGGEKAGGFALNPSGSTKVECAFLLPKISLELKRHLEDMEKDRKMTFRGRMYEIDRKKLTVAAFVQDSKTKQVLQAAFVKVQP